MFSFLTKIINDTILLRFQFIPQHDKETGREKAHHQNLPTRKPPATLSALAHRRNRLWRSGQHPGPKYRPPRPMHCPWFEPRRLRRCAYLQNSPRICRQRILAPRIFLRFWGVFYFKKSRFRRD